MTEKRFGVGLPVVMKGGWGRAGRTGTALGPETDYLLDQLWVPVLWDDDEDPDFVKAAALDPAPAKTEPGTCMLTDCMTDAEGGVKGGVCPGHRDDLISNGWEESA